MTEPSAQGDDLFLALQIFPVLQHFIFDFTCVYMSLLPDGNDKCNVWY